MSRIAELDQYVNYCERIKRELTPLRGEFSQELLPRLDAALQAADRALETARGPVKIGVAGEFSAGKTLLLDALMGGPNLLPVDEVPTTGNITEIHFGQLDAAAPDELCRINRRRICFLSREQVMDCRNYMIERALLLLGKIGVSQGLISRLDGLRGDDGSASWQALEECCGDIWRDNKNPELRYLIKDLMQLARTYPGAGAALCGREFEVGTEVLSAALSLPDAPANLQEAAFAEVLPPPVLLSSAPSSLDESTVRAAFHLIRSCELELLIAKKIWNLSSLKGQNQLVLLDFPGLGASSSSVRDIYLCRREMAEVQTMLLLVNGNRPGSGEAASLFSMMQEDRPGSSLKDAVLVGIGRFDQLRIQDDEERALRERLAASGSSVSESDSLFPDEEEELGLLDEPDEEEALPAARLSEEDVRNGIRALSRVLSDAGSLTPDLNRTVLLSPVIYLGELHRHLAPSGEGQRSATLERALLSAQPARELWGSVIDKLAADSAAGQLAELLAELAKDGGISRLRNILGEHVAAHGMRQLVDSVVRRTAEAADAVKQLVRAIPDEEQVAAVPNDRLTEVTGYLRDLKRAYARLKVELRDNPRDLKYEVPGRSMLLVEHFREEIEARVTTWPEWRNLYVLIDSDTSLVAMRKGRRESILDDEDDDEMDALAVPLCGADFKPRFRETYDQLRQKIEQLAEDGMEEWLDEISRELAAERAHLNPLVEEAAEQIGSSGDKRNQKRLAQIQKALEPRRLKRALFDKALREAGTTSPRVVNEGHAADHFFPLRDERRFGWDPAFAELDPPMPSATRHYAQVLRLRTTLAVALSRELKERVSRINKEASQLLTQAIDDIATRIIDDCLNDEELLGTLAGDAPSSAESKPDPRSLLQSLYDAQPGA